MHRSGAGVRGPWAGTGRAGRGAGRGAGGRPAGGHGPREAGIAKSSLISEFLGGQRDLSAIAASGETAEAMLPYGVVQQLAAGAAVASPGVLAGLELLFRGPGPAADPLAGRHGVARADLLAAGQTGDRGGSRRSAMG